MLRRTCKNFENSNQDHLQSAKTTYHFLYILLDFVQKLTCKRIHPRTSEFLILAVMTWQSLPATWWKPPIVTGWQPKGNTASSSHVSSNPETWHGRTQNQNTTKLEKEQPVYYVLCICWTSGRYCRIFCWIFPNVKTVNGASTQPHIHSHFNLLPHQALWSCQFLRKVVIAPFTLTAMASCSAVYT